MCIIISNSRGSKCKKKKKKKSLASKIAHVLDTILKTDILLELHPFTSIYG